MWGTRESKRFTAKNVLSDEMDFSNSTVANFWLSKAKEQDGKVKGEGFVMKVGNNKRSVVGVKIRNTDSTKNGGRATEIFKLEGSLLKEPESLGQRVQEHDLSWTPEILKESGQWEELLTKMMKPRDQSEANPPLETFFFFAAKEVRYLWFHLLTFNGLGGGLQFFAPILHSGEINRE